MAPTELLGDTSILWTRDRGSDTVLQARQQNGQQADAGEGAQDVVTDGTAQVQSVIGPQDHFDGAYESRQGLRIQGRVEGSLRSGGHVLIEEGGHVTADVAAAEVTVAGRYDGNAECHGRFEITPSGVVTGEVNTQMLVVREGGYFDGELTMKKRQEWSRVSEELRGSEL